MSARVPTALRVLAIAIAIAGLIDPALALKRPAPPSVIFEVEPDNPRAAAVKQALIEQLGAPEAGPASQPVAAITIGDRVDLEALPEGLPVSSVTLDDSPNLRIASFEPPPRALPGRSIVLTVGIESSGLGGEPAVVAVEESGIEFAHVDVKVPSKGAAQVQVPYVPSKGGQSIARVVVRPIERESRHDDNAVDIPVTVAGTPLRIATYEPRPSWSAGFVRRALESDPAFSVSSLVHVSRGVAARAGSSPVRLAREHLEPFDAVLVGAPEELQQRDVEVLREYARVRGGAVVLLPDRRPAGPFTSLVPAAGFDEVLLENQASLGGIESSELALPRQPVPGWVPLAQMPQPSGRPAVLWWPEGDGRIIYSGALDAWRYRARSEESFGRFWRDVVGVAALAAPPRLSIVASPAVARPADRVHVRVRLRRTEFDRVGASPVTLPFVAAEALGPRGREPVRLWPSAEPGVFEGTYRAGGEGRYDLRATAAGSLTADAVLTVDDTVARGPVTTRNRIATVVAATGGIAVEEDNLAAIVRQARDRTAPAVATTVHPMRSPWWIVPFAGLLCAEWAVRRRRGLR